MLTVVDNDLPLTPLVLLWIEALGPVVVRHPNRNITLQMSLENDQKPCLTFSLDTNLDSDTDETVSPFNIVNVRLTYFPGVALAQQWLAAAWGCFLQHEGLELVTVGDPKTRVLDPHLKRSRLDIFHKGFPFQLTPESLLVALATAIPLEEAQELVSKAA